MNYTDPSGYAETEYSLRNWAKANSGIVQSTSNSYYDKWGDWHTRTYASLNMFGKTVSYSILDGYIENSQVVNNKTGSYYTPSLFPNRYLSGGDTIVANLNYICKTFGVPASKVVIPKNTQATISAPPPKAIISAPPSPQPKKDYSRTPDFYSFTINAGVVYAGGTLVMIIDYYGNQYTGVGYNAGPSATVVSASITANWVDQDERPREEDLANYIKGLSVSLGGGFVAGGAETWVPSQPEKVNSLGLYSPQAGGSVIYTFETNPDPAVDYTPKAWNYIH